MANKVTIYIEDTDIKLLVTSGKKVDKWASLLLEPSLVRDGVIVDEEQVAESVKNLLKLGGVSQKKVTVGLSGLNSIFRIITLPEISQSLLPEAVMNEARRVIPVPLDQVYVSYQQIPSSKGEIRLFLVAHPRNSTDVLVKTMIKAGLKPEILDLAPLALARCSNESRSIIINSWQTYIDIIIMSDNLPQVIRSMSLPTEAVAVEEKLPFIAEELARTVAFYNSSNPANQLDAEVPLFVCGDLADVPDSWESLVERSKHSVSTMVPPMEYPETFSPYSYMVNIGLALKGQLPGGAENHYSIIDYNAMPEVYRPVGISMVRILTPVAIVIGLCALAWGGLLVKDVADETARIKNQKMVLESQAIMLNGQVMGLINEINDVDAIIEAYPDQVAQITGQIQTMKNIDIRFEETLAGLSEGLNKTDADINEVIDLLPAIIKLNEMDYSNDEIRIMGTTQQEDDIIAYAKTLENSAYFSEVTILSINETYRQENEQEYKMYNFEFLVK